MQLTEALAYLATQGLSAADLSSLHHFALKGRAISFAQAADYFGVSKELRDRNDAFAHRVLFVAQQHRHQPQPWDPLLAEARRRWPFGF
jgi:hypothetical protein